MAYIGDTGDARIVPLRKKQIYTFVTTEEKKKKWMETRKLSVIRFVVILIRMEDIYDP